MALKFRPAARTDGPEDTRQPGGEVERSDTGMQTEPQIKARFVRVELPLPPRECSPNERTSRRRKAEVIARYRRDCALAYRHARVPALPTPVVVHLDYYLERPTSLLARYKAADDWHPTDDDNGIAAFKAGRDALQDAGVIPADTTRYVKMGHCEFHSHAPAGTSPRCLVVTLEYLDAEGERA